MTTDDETNMTNETSNDQTGEQTPEASPTSPTDPIKQQETLMNEMMNRFNDKLNDILDKHEVKVKEMQASIDEKEREINKLRKVNSEILMSTDIRGNDQGEIDFRDVDFKDVDWNVQAKAMFEVIDKRIA